MKHINEYFSGSQSISFEDAARLYGLGISTTVISIFVLATLHLKL